MSDAMAEWSESLMILRMPNCSVGDCEFKATYGSDKCFCHSRGFHPPLTMEQYEALEPDGILGYRKQLRGLERQAAAMRREGR